MDKLGSLQAFIRTAELRSFVAAGRVLGISSSAIGKSVAKLEQQLGLRLLQRNTRNVRLTEEGRQFYERCRPLLIELEDAEAMLTHAMGAPRGRLRVSLPTAGYRFLVPVLGEFRQRYPEVELELDFNDQIVDVIEGGFDMVIRSGAMPDSGLRARRLGPFCFLLCASPDYLARRGEPRVPADLEAHDCILFRFASSGKLQEWSLRLAPGEPAPHLTPALVCNNAEAGVLAAEQGLGILYTADFLVRDALASGRLQRVLKGYETQRGQFWALWPAQRQVAPKLRVFLDFLGERLFVQAAEN
jgi:DNA-binding transcriptional LysR family regulator